MSGKVVHLSAESHGKMMQFCKEHNLQASVWVSNLVMDAVTKSVIPVEKKTIPRPPAPLVEEDTYSRPPFWEQKIDG